jgi:hypothetical protein
MSCVVLEQGRTIPDLKSLAGTSAHCLLYDPLEICSPAGDKPPRRTQRYNVRSRQQRTAAAW